MRFLIAWFLGVVAMVASPVGWTWCGALTSRSAVVTARVVAEGEVSLVVKPEKGAPATVKPVLTEPMAEGKLLRFEVGNLTADTRYGYRLVDAKGTPLDTEPRELRTFPVEGKAASFRFAVASCAKESDSAVFTAAANQKPRFFLHTGDFHYFNIGKNKVEVFRAAYDHHLSAPRLRTMLAGLPLIYQWDDHDFGPNDSNRTSPSREASFRNYRELVPGYPLTVKDVDSDAVGGPSDQAFTVGRVRFILSDLRSRRDPATRRMMSAAQDEWLKAQLKEAKGKYPLIFWVSSVPWNGKPTGDDRWQGYPAHRAEIANFIKDEKITGVCILSGDAHMTAIDDGTNSDFADGKGAPLRVFQAGPIANKGSYKGGPYSHGARADTPPEIGKLCQFGIVDVKDDGREIRVSWSGREGGDGVGDQVLLAQKWGTGKIEYSFTVR